MIVLVEELKQLGIEIIEADGKLRYDAPEGVLTPRVLRQILANESALIEYVKSIKKASFAGELTSATESKELAGRDPSTAGEIYKSYKLKDGKILNLTMEDFDLLVAFFKGLKNQYFKNKRRAQRQL